jgi:hypothetical protein
MSTLSQDPLTKYLVKYTTKHGFKLHKLVDFKDVLSLIALSEDFKKYSVQAYISNKPIQNSMIQGLSNNLNWILSEVPEKSRLPALIIFLSAIFGFALYDHDFRAAAKHYKKEFLHTLLFNDILKPVFVNKNYTNLLLNALRIDMQIQRTNDIDDLLANLSETFYEYRKELYKTFAQRIQCYKEELIANVMHPSRLQKMLDSGMSLDEVLDLY